ncbi:DUF4221 family protein [Algoriphagus antarcticus]|nr:DUF4221 family protein [Algoriphagus antarcticus]
MYNYSKFFIIISLIFGCSNKKDESIFAAIPVTSIEFPLDNETANFGGNRVQLANLNSKDILLLSNPIFNRIYQYDYNNQELIGSTDYPVEGPKGVGNVSNFYFHNRDTILISGKNVNWFFITDLGNSYMERFNFDFSREDRGKVPVATEQSGIIFHDQSVFLTNPIAYVPGMYAAPEEYKKIENSNFAVEYNIYSPAFVSNDLLFPIEYTKSVYSDYFNFMSQEKVGDNIIYSFGLSDSIIVFNTKDQEIIKHIASSYLADDLPKVSLANSVEEIGPEHEQYRLTTFLNSMNYGKIFYDSYKELYYRVVEKPKPEIVVDVPQRTKPFGIIVLNKNFEKIMEVDFEYGKYVLSNMFVSSKGLNVLNYEKILTDESHIVFDVFDFSK